MVNLQSTVVKVKSCSWKSGVSQLSSHD